MTNVPICLRESNSDVADAGILLVTRILETPTLTTMTQMLSAGGLSLIERVLFHPFISGS